MKIHKSNIEKILKDCIGGQLDFKTIFIAGSKVEGFGNEKSDIDVFGIFQTTDFCNVRPQVNDDIRWDVYNDRIVCNIIHNGERYDIELLAESGIKSLLDKYCAISVNNSIDVLSEDEVDFIHRIKHSRVIFGDEYYRNLRSMIDFDIFGVLLAKNYTEDYQNALEDIQGALISRDYWTAYFNTQRALEYVLSAAVAIEGETNPNPKWLFRKLDRFSQVNGDSSLVDLLLSTHRSSNTEDDIENNIIKILEQCQKINVNNQLRIKCVTEH